MEEESDLKSQVGIGMLLGLGWILVAFSTVRTIRSDASVHSRAVAVVIPVALALVLFVGAVGIVHQGLQNRAFRVAVWTVGGTVAGTVAVALNVMALPLIQPDFTLTLFLLINAAAAGAALGFLIGIYDASQQRLQEELSAKSAEAEALSQRLSVLNRVLRHDIRTQAQIIQGYTDRLVAGELSVERAAERVERANRRLTELSEEARQLESLLAEDDFETEPIDLVSLVRDAGDTVQSAHDSLTIQYDLPDRQLVEAPPLLTQVVEHLLYNVVEHSESAAPQAEVSLTTNSEGVKLTVLDNGPGIPESEPLLSAEDTESQLRHSQGVGLWLVTWIVDEAAGEVEIETPPADDVGTVVTVTLPSPS